MRKKEGILLKAIALGFAAEFKALVVSKTPK